MRACAPQRWWVARLAISVDRVLERRREIEQAAERPRGPGAAVGDRRERAAGEPLDRARHAGRRGARHRGVLDEGQRQAVVAPPRLPARQVAGVGMCGDDAPRRRRHRVLVERLAPLALDPGRAQRERAAERAAQVVALGKLPGVDRQQRAGPREERHLG